MAGHFKQLTIKSQEKVLTIGPDCDTPYFRLTAALEFCTKPANSAICCRLYNQYSPLAIPCSFLLLSEPGQGLESY